MSPLPDGIRHVIVLMLENRSFDHLLGNLPGVDGPRGRSNVDPRDHSVVPVTFDAQPTSPALPEPNNPSQITGDPQHDFAAVNRQLFETDRPGPATPVTCGGFIMAQRASGDADASRIAREVMRCYDTPAALTTLTALASEFLVCDCWHASVPGPTWPNRLFVHAATSFGTLDNTPRLFDGTTIYDRLSAAHVDWAIYYHDMPQSFCFRELWDRTDRFHRRCMRPIDEFYKEVRAHRADSPAHATLPSYVFIEPGYFEPSRGILARLADLVKWIAHLLGAPIQPSRGHANDQHAPHDVRLGELLIADVYDALRANEDVWQHCLLVVLHDEHGGLYDHVHPGGAAAPEPSHPGDPFAFDRAGLRVPALLVSPFVAHGVDSTPYDHASIIRTVREHFCPDAAPLSERESHSTALGATSSRALVLVCRGGSPGPRPRS